MEKPKKINKNTSAKVEKEVEQKPKKRTKSQILNDLKVRENEINIEILNIGIGRARYINKSGITYFDLEMGESDLLSLKLVKEIATKSMSFFRDFIITVSNVFPEDISVDDVLMYLGLDKVYKNIDNYDCDFLSELILDEDTYEFESKLKESKKSFVVMIGCKMIQLYRSGEEISREKERIVCEILKIDNLNF